jgi:hypothetical protein
MIVERQTLQERFAKLEWTQQMGNLASTLARISSRAESPQYDELVASLLREAALFIEWSAAQAPESMLLDLATLQRECLAWRSVWPVDSSRALLSLQARNASDRLLQRAHLI